MLSLKAFGRDGRIELVEGPVPMLSTEGATPRHVLVKPLAVGICGTDLDIVAGHVDPAYVTYPITIGHEWCGVVEGISEDCTTGIAVGDRCVVQGIIPCEKCRECLSGCTNRCEVYDEYGFNRDGAACTGGGVLALERLVYPLAECVSIESGVLVEPAAVVMQGLMKASPAGGGKVLVVGDGTIGLLSATMSRVCFTPRQVDVVGLKPDQAQLAKMAGADNFYTTEQFAGKGDELYDFVVEASGSKGGIQSAIKKIARGGKLLLLGFLGHGVSIPLVVDDVVNGDISIFGSFGSSSAAWQRVVELLNSGALDLTFLVTHRFPLRDFQQGLDTLSAAAGSGPRGKVLLLP